MVAVVPVLMPLPVLEYTVQFRMVHPALVRMPIELL